MARGKGISDPEVAKCLRADGDLRLELENLIHKCDDAITRAKTVLRDAGIKPEDVNSPHIFEPEHLKHLAQTMLRIADGEYTWNLEAKPKLIRDQSVDR